MVWLVSDARVLASAECATSRSARRTGLLGRDHLDGALVIEPCRWVHTVGMRFPIDVAFLDRDGVVVKITAMKQHRIGLPVRRAHLVVEAERGAFERWGLRVGDTVEVRHDDGDDEPDRDRTTRRGGSHRSAPTGPAVDPTSMTDTTPPDPTPSDPS